MADLGGRRLIDHVFARVSGENARIAINAPGAAPIAESDLPVLPDMPESGMGPLAGVLAAIRWAESLGFTKVFTVPADTPFLPHDLIDRLDAPEAKIVTAASAGQVHHVCARWACSLANELERLLTEGEVRAVWAFAEMFECTKVDFSASGGVDPFFNINTPEDLATAQASLARMNP